MDAYRRPCRRMPHTSQKPKTPEMRNPTSAIRWIPRACGPRFREDADHGGAEQPAEDDDRDGDPVRRLVDVVVDLVDARVLDVHLEGPLPQLLEDVRDLVGHVPCDGGQPECLDPRPLRERAGVEAVHEQPARIRLRDLEHVELRIDLLADRGQRRDRLVEDHETTRELQVHRVDELEALTDHLQRVDVREPAAVVAVEEDLELASELLLARCVVADSEVAQTSRDRVDVLRRSVDEEHRQPRHVVVGQLPCLPEVDEPERAGLEHVDVRRVRVRMEEPVPEHHGHPGVRETVRDIAPLVGTHRAEVEVGDLRPAKELEREDA